MLLIFTVLDFTDDWNIEYVSVINKSINRSYLYKIN